MAKERNIVAFGPREEIIGLQAAGVQIVPVEQAADLPALLRQRAEQPEVRLVLLSESVAAGVQHLVGELRRETGTLFLLVPSHRGSEGLSFDWLRQTMELAIGVDLISDT